MAFLGEEEQFPAGERAEKKEMPTLGVRDREHTELIIPDGFITLGLVPALLQLGELTQPQGFEE